VNGALDMDLSQDIEVHEYTVTVYPTSSNGPSYEVRMDKDSEPSETAVRACSIINNLEGYVQSRGE
jgi:hypothetical protein